MKRPSTSSQTRSIVAIALIVASFLSAFILSRAANRTELVWSARTLLNRGDVVTMENLELRRVAMSSIATIYFGGSENILRSGVLREIHKGELIPRTAIGSDLKVLSKSQAPISVQTSDAPAGLMPGDLVNVYHVADPHISQIVTPPALIISRVRVLAVDSKNQNLGGSVALTLSIETRLIFKLLKATESGRLVLVRLNG